MYVIASVLVIGMIVPVAAQDTQDNQTNETEQRNQSFSVTGDCMMSPNATDEQAFMTCRYYLEDSDSDMSFLDQMREWMARMFGGSNMNQSGQGMGGMQGR